MARQNGQLPGFIQAPRKENKPSKVVGLIITGKNKQISCPGFVSDPITLQPAKPLIEKAPSSDAISPISVVIPTFRRPQWCAALLRQLRVENTFVPMTIHVHDDASGIDYGEVKELVDDLEGRFYSWPSNYGKTRYWEFTTEMWDTARSDGNAWLLWLNDDFDLCDNFLNRLFTAWKSIPDPRAAALIPLADPRYSRGQSSTPLARVRKATWMDCFGLFPRRTLDSLDWRIDPVKSNDFSSCVNTQISQRLKGAGSSLWQTTTSLVDHRGATFSQMHPKLREKEPLHAHHFHRKG